MTAVTYTAQRKLASGHSATTVYSMDLSVTREGLTEKVETLRRTVEPISKKNAEIIRFGNRRTFDMTLAPLTGTQLDLVREFLESCEDATFTFDPYGTVAAPGTTFLARLTSDGYTLQREVMKGTGGSADYFKISFSLAEA